jgi:hypothetical protein
MIALEKHLIEKGYLKMKYDHKQGLIEEDNRFHIISTMENLYYLYVLPKDLENAKKQRFNNNMFTIGLNEAGKPVTLISPRPIVITEIGENYIDTIYINDDTMNRLLKDKTNEEIIELVQRNTIELSELK